MIFPCDVFAEPQEVAVLIGQLSRDADLVAVEVVGLLSTFTVLVGEGSIGEAAYVRTAHNKYQNWRFS